MTARENRLVVLLAEDDENDVILIRRACERLCFLESLIVLPDGDQTIAYLCGDGKFAERQKHPFPDLLLLDHLMPRLSGLDVLSWLRSEPRFEHLPVAIFSTGISPAQRRTVEQLNAVCCEKPSAWPELPTEIERAIRSALVLMSRSNPEDGRGPAEGSGITCG